jgi:hypothetical protein
MPITFVLRPKSLMPGPRADPAGQPDPPRPDLEEASGLDHDQER